jgi:DNA-binding MarR family transcriptional regulator
MSDADEFDVEAIANLDKLIHEPARLAIMMLLYVVEGADFLYLKTQTKLTNGNLSSHLGKLEDAAYVEIEKTFSGKVPRTMIRMTDGGRDAFRNYLAGMRGAMNGLPD